MFRYSHLHSRMFLLILFPSHCNHNAKFLFTFHNVSINTVNGAIGTVNSAIFTFHNVSINTQTVQMRSCHLTKFTFHNVSINTGNKYLTPLTDVSFTFHNVSINTTIQTQTTGKP